MERIFKSKKKKKERNKKTACKWKLVIQRKHLAISENVGHKGKKT